MIQRQQRSHRTQFKLQGKSRQQSPTQEAVDQDESSYHNYINKAFDRRNTQNVADLREGLMLVQCRHDGLEDNAKLQSTTTAFGARAAGLEATAMGRPFTGHRVEDDEDAAQGDVVDLEMDIEMEPSQAQLSIQQPQIMEHEHMKMRKGGDLFFGGRRGEDDEVDERSMGHQQMSRQPFMSAGSSWAAYRANLSQAQLGQPMVIKQQSSSSSNQVRQFINMSDRAEPASVPRRTAKPRSASQSNGGHITEARGIDFTSQDQQIPDMVRLQAHVAGAAATQNLDLVGMNSISEKLQVHLSQTQQMRLNNPFRSKKHSNVIVQRSSGGGAPSLLSQPLLSTQNMGRTLELQNLENTQFTNGRGARGAQAPRTKSSMGVFSEYLNLQGLAGGLQQRRQPRQAGKRPTGASSPMLEQLKSLFNPGIGSKEPSEQPKITGEAARQRMGSGLGLLGRMERKSGLNLYKNVETHQDIDANNEIRAAFVALDRDNQKTLENAPVETLNINAQQSHTGKYSMKSTQRFGLGAGPQTLATQAHTHFVQTQYLHTNTRQTMNETHMLSQKSRKSRGFNSPNAACNVRSSQQMQTSCAGGTPKNFQAITQNIQIGQFNQSRQQVHQQQQLAQRAYTATRPPSQNLLSNIERIIKNNMAQSDMDRQLRQGAATVGKDGADPEGQAKGPSGVAKAKRGSVPQSLHLNLQALQSSNTNLVTSKEEATAIHVHTLATPGISQQDTIAQKPHLQEKKHGGEQQEAAQPDTVRSLLHLQQHTERLQSFYDSKYPGAQGQQSSTRRGDRRLDSYGKSKGNAGVRQTLEQLKMQSPFQMNKALESAGAGHEGDLVALRGHQRAGKLMSKQLRENESPNLEDSKGLSPAESEKEASPLVIGRSPPRLGQRQGPILSYQGSVLGGSASASPVMERNYSSPSSLRHSESENVLDTIDREAVEIRNPNRMPGCGGSNGAVATVGTTRDPAEARNQKGGPPSKQVFKLDLEKIKNPANKAPARQPSKAEVQAVLTELSQPSLVTLDENNGEAGLLSKRSQAFPGSNTNGQVEASSSRLKRLSAQQQRTQTHRTPTDNLVDSAKGQRKTLKMNEAEQPAAGRSRSGTARKVAGGASGSSTARISMGYPAGGSTGRGQQAMALGRSSSQQNLVLGQQTTYRSDQKIELSSLAPVIKEHIAEEDGENEGENIENQKYFNLITNYDQQKTLGQKVIDGIPHRAHKKSGVNERKSIQGSRDASSFDSVNPQDLILNTIDSRSKAIGAGPSANAGGRCSSANYASHLSQVSKLSKFSKIQNILNVQYLHTRSSNISSVHHYNTHQTQTSQQASEQVSQNQSSFATNKQSKVSSSFSKPGHHDAMGPGSSETKIDKFIDKIQDNLNTFTTDQFEQLRETVKSKGFGAAQLEAQAVFGLKRGTVRIKRTKEAEEMNQGVEKEEADGWGFRGEFELGDGLLRKIQVVEPRTAGEEEPWAEQGPRTHQAICTGFLSAPNVAFRLDSEDEGEQDKKKTNRHMATVREDLLPENGQQTLAGLSGKLPTFLLNHLVSERILSSFIRLKCQIISCGLEHCLALMSHASEPLISNDQGSPSILDEGEYQRGNVRRIQPGFVYSWGLGNSGCLGHGDHATLEEPRLIKSLAQATTKGGSLKPSVVYVEAGGYHNGAITLDNQALVWGRGDVGQLGLSKDVLTEDQRGRVALSPTPIGLHDEKVVQLALGEVHTLILTESSRKDAEQQQQLYSCGWNDFGQLGISTEQEEAEKHLPRHKVRFDFEDQSEGIVQIKCGAVFSATLTTKGHVYAWGNNTSGQMGCVPASGGLEKSIESEDGQAGQKMASSHGTQEHASGTRGPQRVLTPTKVALDDERPGVRVLDITAGDRLVIAKTKQSDDDGSEKLYAWGQGFLLDDQECQELVTNRPVILGGGLELTSKYVIEQEQEPNEDTPAELDRNQEQEKAEPPEEDALMPQAVPVIAFQISATPYESKSTEPKKKDIVPRLELNGIVANLGKAQEAFQHNIPAEKVNELRPSNLISSASSCVSSARNQQLLSSKRQPKSSSHQHFKPPVPRGPGPNGDIKPRKGEFKQEYDMYKANTLPKAAKAEHHALDRRGSAVVGHTPPIAPSANAQRQSAADKESDLVTVKDAEDYKNYLRNRENDDTDELSSLNKSDQKVLKLIMQDSNSRHSPTALKGQHGGGAGAGNPSAWTSNGGGSERGNFIENNTNSCVTVNDANFPQGASDAYHFNSGSAQMDYDTTQYGPASSPNELTSTALHGGMSYGGDSHSQRRVAEHSSNLEAHLYQNLNTNVKSDIPKSSIESYMPKQKAPKNREFKVSRPQFLDQSGSELSSNAGVPGDRATLTGGEFPVNKLVLPPAHTVLPGPDADQTHQSQIQQIKISETAMPQEQAESPSTNYRDGVVQILSPAPEVDQSAEDPTLKQQQEEINEPLAAKVPQEHLEKNDDGREELDHVADRKDYQSGPFTPMSPDDVAQPEMMEQKEGSRIKEKSPEAKHVSQAPHVQLDLLGAEFKPSNPTVNRFTQGIMNNTRTAQGSSSPMNPMLTISTPMRLQDQSSANNILETVDQRQSSVEHAAQAKSLQNDAKKLSQQTSSNGLTKNDEITELNANSNRNLLQNYRSSRNMPEHADLVLQSTNSVNTHNSLRKSKHYKLHLINRSGSSGREQLGQRGEGQQPFESKQSADPRTHLPYNVQPELNEANMEQERDSRRKPDVEMDDQLFMTRMEEQMSAGPSGARQRNEIRLESNGSTARLLATAVVVTEAQEAPATTKSGNGGKRGAHNVHGLRPKEHVKGQTLRVPASSKFSAQSQMGAEVAANANAKRKFDASGSSLGCSTRQEERTTAGNYKTQRLADLKVEARTPGRGQVTQQQRAGVSTVKLQAALHRAKNSCSQLSTVKHTSPISRAAQHPNQATALKRAASGRLVEHGKERPTPRTEQLPPDSKMHPEMASQGNLSTQGLQSTHNRTKLRLVKSPRTLKDFQPVLRSKEGPSATARLASTALAGPQSDPNDSSRLPDSNKKLSVLSTQSIHPLKLRIVSRTKPVTPVKTGSLGTRSTGKKSQQALQQSQGSTLQVQSGGDLLASQTLPAPARQLFSSTLTNKRSSK